MIKTLLVDDEPMALTTLAHVLAAFPVFTIAGTCTSPEAALEFVKNQPIDAVFLDIEMPRLKGVDLAAELRRTNPHLIIIFVTAYRDYALRAFEINAQDYLIKPVTIKRMALAADKIQQQFTLLNAAKTSTGVSETAAISGKADGRSYLLKPQDIIYVAAMGKIVTAATTDGVYRLQGSLTQWENSLPPQLFCRCHKSFLVNLRYVEYLAPRFKNDCVLKVIGRSEYIPVSRTFLRAIKERLNV